MKLLIYTLALLSISINSMAQANVYVVFNSERNQCDIRTDCGYGYAYSYSERTLSLRKEAMQNASTYCDDYVPDATYDDAVNNMVIVKHSRKDYNGCNRVTYGAGFGSTYDEAYQRAVRNLMNRDWNFNRSRHTVNIVENRTF